MLQITAFVSLVESLASNIRRRNKSMTLIEWKSFIEEILDTFLVMDEQDKDDLYTHIIDKFNQYEMLNLLYLMRRYLMMCFHQNFVIAYKMIQ